METQVPKNLRLKMMTSRKIKTKMAKVLVKVSNKLKLYPIKMIIYMHMQREVSAPTLAGLKTKHCNNSTKITYLNSDPCLVNAQLIINKL